MKRFLKVLAVSVILYLPNQAAAWSMLGHRIVGQIAENHLTAKARKGIKNVLGNESLAMSSNWGDFVKSDPTYDYLYNWHFVNLPAGLDQTGVFNYLDSEKDPNVYNKTLEMVGILKDKQSKPDQKKFALRMLVHMVGDLNQPMHTARKEDLGGNRVFVTWFGEKSNLHRVWDDQLIDYQRLSYTEYVKAIDFSSAETTLWKSKSLKDFIYGSYQACNKIYETVKPEDKLSYKYNFDHVDTLNQQLLKGGICLSNILNEIYK
ncbi:MAG: S1/P1 Nuclease [Pedobacter sp.]|nr:MAG: S1/P1 Nuclease [Pedobacter sp.]